VNANNRPSAESAAARVDTSLTTPPNPVTAELALHMARACEAAGGWLPFDDFMAMALYTPGLGYYANGRVTFGRMPGGQSTQVPGTPPATGALQTPGELPGSDFVTAPELSPLFGEVLAHQVVQALQATGTREVWEFGAGSGALAYQILKHIVQLEKATSTVFVDKYVIVDLSGTLRARQQDRLREWAGRVQWADALPDALNGVVLGNEVLDAMPVKLLARVDGQWFERGVVRVCSHGTGGGAPVGTPGDVGEPSAVVSGHWAWADRPTTLRPPVDVPGEHDHLTEIHPQAEAFMRTLADRLQQGAAFLIDYGFPEAEYFHPQRHMGTLACHHLHKMDDNPLAQVGDKDITAHVNFTGVALAAQDAGLDVLGYTTQGRFLINCGLATVLDALPHDAAGLAQRAMAAKLVNEHEMGELFKVLGVAPPASSQGWLPMGFAAGDRTHTL
jgi:SAM-dependent MidA family methyltransferase